MFQWLDKYMDNLKSPYWEVYIFIGAAIFGIAGIVITFIDPKGLGDKFGNSGSFIGGLVAFLAFILAAHEYLKYTKNRGQNEQVNLAVNLLPKFSKKTNYFYYRISNSIEKTSELIKLYPNHDINKTKNYLNSTEAIYKELIDYVDEIRLEYKIFIAKSGYLKSKSEKEYNYFIDKVSMLELASHKCILTLKDLKSELYGVIENDYENIDNEFIFLIKESYEIETSVSFPIISNSSIYHDKLEQWRKDFKKVTDDLSEALHPN